MSALSGHLGRLTAHAFLPAAVLLSVLAQHPVLMPLSMVAVGISLTLRSTGAYRRQVLENALRYRVYAVDYIPQMILYTLAGLATLDQERILMTLLLLVSAIMCYDLYRIICWEKRMEDLDG